MIDFIGEGTRKKLPTCWEYIRGFIEQFVVDFNTNNNYGDLVLLVEETRVSGKNYQPAGNISHALYSCVLYTMTRTNIFFRDDRKWLYVWMYIQIS